MIGRCIEGLVYKNVEIHILNHPGDLSHKAKDREGKPEARIPFLHRNTSKILSFLLYHKQKALSNPIYFLKYQKKAKKVLTKQGKCGIIL
jgi:hypothetical protein